MLWTITSAVLAVTVVKSVRRLTWSSLLPAAGLCLAAVFVDRLGPLFALASLLTWRSGWSGTDQAPSPQVTTHVPAPVWMVDAAIVVAAWVIVTTTAVQCLAVTGSWAPDLLAASALDASSVSGRLVLPFDWGEYAIWHWGPRLRVSMDGRRETVYSPETLNIQDAVVDGAPEGISYLLRERPEYVWLKRSAEPTRAALSGNGYRIDVVTAESFIAVRDDLATVAVGQPQRSCFP